MDRSLVGIDHWVLVYFLGAAVGICEALSLCHSICAHLVSASGKRGIASRFRPGGDRFGGGHGGLRHATGAQCGPQRAAEPSDFQGHFRFLPIVAVGG